MNWKVLQKKTNHSMVFAPTFEDITIKVEIMKNSTSYWHIFQPT